MTAIALITPKTAADATGAVIQVDPTQAPITVFATGLAGAEVITVKLSPDEGVTPATLYQNGTAVTLSTTNTAVVLDAPGYYTFDKPSTAGVVGIYASRRGHL